MKKSATFSSRIWVTLHDVILGAVCMYLVMRMRFYLEGKPVPEHIDIRTSVVFALSVFLVWMINRTYRPIWRFTSFDDVRALMRSVFWASVMTPLVLFLFFNRAEYLPRSVPVLNGALFFIALIAARAIIMTVENGDIKTLFRKGQYTKIPAVLIGKSQALHNYLRDEVRAGRESAYFIRGLIETDGKNKGRSIRGVPVIGNLDDIKTTVMSIEKAVGKKPTLILLDTNGGRKRAAHMVKLASSLGTRLVRLRPGPHNELTPFEAADLIGRQTKSLDMAPVENLLGGKTVMITGAGGTIGSELVRQVAVCTPQRLVLIDSSEMNLYNIDQEMRALTGLSYQAHLGDIRDAVHMEEIFQTEKPDIVLHAAALKHVPLMETNPVSAIQTNVGGTKTILELAQKYKAQSFTLISTDKAVSPTNIMGASKRVAELLTTAPPKTKTPTATCAVRFGNVLASNGSVIPLFEKQIEEGGPVTVTDKDVTRYFMTKEEAASLVLQATALRANMADETPIVYVLDMGEPVNITRLARQLIRLRGLVPDKDIQIQYTGLRPGEKLEEVLTSPNQKLVPTSIDGIMCFTETQAVFPNKKQAFAALLAAAGKRDGKAMIHALKDLVPEFKSSKT